ncbi:MAG: PepSY domain-containing protein [Novosphingobium sp.]|nr:PepSY domain-containing protein [Novosphingobium sp.]
MRRLVAILMLAVAASAAMPGAVADPADHQGEVRKERKAGKVMSLRDIEDLVLPDKRGMQYLGPEYDPVAMVYRLKFIGKGRVYYVDVDAKTGNIISGSQ